jgi:hypothetical protein
MQVYRDDPEREQWRLLGMGRECLREVVLKRISPLCTHLQADMKVVMKGSKYWWKLVFVDGCVGCVLGRE